MFIHGVTGTASKTWTNGKTGASWPEMLKKKMGNDADIFVYSYRSTWFGSNPDLEEVSVLLRTELNSKRIFESYDEIYFIAHSMGGIILKQFLNTLNTPEDSMRLRKTRAAFFIATPARGANSAELATWVSLNPQFRSMSPRRAQDFLDSIENSWGKLWKNRSDNLFPRAYCAYEIEKTWGMMIVPKLYTSQLCDDQPIGFAYNHQTIVEPEDNGNPVYEWVLSKIKEQFNVTPNLPEQCSPKEITLIAANVTNPLRVGAAKDAQHDSYGTVLLSIPPKDDPTNQTGWAKYRFNVACGGYYNLSVTLASLADRPFVTTINGTSFSVPGVRFATNGYEPHNQQTLPMAEVHLVKGENNRYILSTF